jgi:plasmid stabilization system protein ParE
VKRRVSIRPRAERDLLQARDWYEGQSVGLGDKFFAAVRGALTDLPTTAERQPEYYRGFRRVLLRHFPYKIFYRIEGDRVIIFRILHSKREHRRFL